MSKASLKGHRAESCRFTNSPITKGSDVETIRGRTVGFFGGGGTPMAKGDHCNVTGILRAGRWGYSLEAEGGGTWRLDVTGSAAKYLDQRVTIQGIRSEFDMIDVYYIHLAAPPF